MHWFARGEVYTGQWENGSQHGVGTHLWTFKSCDSSQVSLITLFSLNLWDTLRYTPEACSRYVT